MAYDIKAKQLAVELQSILEEKKKTKRFMVAVVVYSLMLTLPWVTKFFTAEGKSIDGCAEYITEKLGDLWEVLVTEEEINAINDAMFDYYGITDEALGGVLE